MRETAKVWELWCPTFLNQFSRSEKILEIFLCMFVFGSLTDKPQVGPSRSEILAPRWLPLASLDGVSLLHNPFYKIHSAPEQILRHFYGLN